ncbi:MAG: hypothetical protein IKQ39_02505 [Oscillospiraceae bacterium]|nr:hypothetical protein [Oscillospiraceae bacterium]
MPKYDKHTLPSVHRGILRAAVMLLGLEGHNAAKRFTADDLEIMIGEITAPDTPGDRLNGKGMHYYCAVRPDGAPMPKHPVLGGYCNGNNQPAPSPLTMMDAEYRAALSLYRCGRRAAALKSLSRAAHMLADICCPPHSCGMTYFSKYAPVHKRYESQAQQVFWNGEDEISASYAWAKRAAGTVPYEAYRNILRGTRPQEDGRWQSGELTLLCNSLALSGAEEIPAAAGSSDEARAASITRRVLLSISNTAALLAAFDRDAADSRLRFWEEGRPYWLKGVGKPYAVSEAALYLHYEDDGAFTLSSEDKKYLAVSKLGAVRLTWQPAGMTKRFRFGREPLLTLYPDGDPARLLIISGGKLYCTYRRLHFQTEIFTRQVSFVLVHQKPEGVRFLVK